MSNTDERNTSELLITFEMLNYRCKRGAIVYGGDIYILCTPPRLYKGVYSASAVRYGDAPNSEDCVPLYKVSYKLPQMLDGYTLDFNKNIDSITRVSIADVNVVTALTELDFYGL